MQEKHRFVSAMTAGVLHLLLVSMLQAQLVPNGEFREGTGAPTGWRLEGEGGRWVDHNLLEVTGKGDDSCLWRCDSVKLEPGHLYRFLFRARRVAGTGSAIAGPSCANRDYHEIGPDWHWYGHVFRVPDEGGGYLRLGQWHATGSIQFDAVQLSPVLPVHRQSNDLMLGDGELVREDEYRFVGAFDHLTSNYHRTLESATAGFNSDRWTLGGGQLVTYCLGAPGRTMRSGHLTFTVNHHTAGNCTAEASRDGRQWKPVAAIQAVGTSEAKLPDELFPADRIRVRFRAARNSSLQINQIEFRGPLTSPAPDTVGETTVAELSPSGGPLSFERIERHDRSDGRIAVVMTLRNQGGTPAAGAVMASLDEKDVTDTALPGSIPPVPPHLAQEIRLALPELVAGSHQLIVKIGDSPKAETSQAKIDFVVPDFYRADYGSRIEGKPGDTTVWWCDAAHKVPRQRAAPGSAAPAATMSAARHDYEAVQIVVRPDRDLKELTAKASSLSGPGQSSIPAENVEILRVYYHFVDHPTDATGQRDWWPDALPPWKEPLNVTAHENQPLWVLVYVPKDAAPGDYAGTISLQAVGFAAEVPLRLHVWDFTLPDRNHLSTAFGLSPGMIFQYHNITTNEDRRRILDLYFESFSRHRISPYNPVPLDDIRVKFLPEENPPRAELDFSDFDPAFERAVGKYHFTGYRLPIKGMGGGTFHERTSPQIGDYGEETPQYQAMFSSYVKQLEDHFRAKGWLDVPYIYWFDEPEPKDYSFVRGGFERLRRYAPGLRTMLTEEPVDALAGPINVWCPVTPNFDSDQAEKRRQAGDQFWWYVCTGPKAPYCTLFIDHAATELRVWHWQTWQRGIVGTLVWESNYWTSSAAFPDRPQNPYDDPMGYVSGYSTPKGTKRYWGNGDGRFIYPPLAAAVPGKSAGPVIEPPASSIRWEMLREGVEDYEYLHLLRECLSSKRPSLSPAEVTHYESLLQVPEAITRSMTSFTTDPAPIYARRAEIAAAVERLSK